MQEREGEVVKIESQEILDVASNRRRGWQHLIAGGRVARSCTVGGESRAGSNVEKHRVEETRLEHAWVDDFYDGLSGGSAARYGG
jgi:hypothetical protein